MPSPAAPSAPVTPAPAWPFPAQARKTTGDWEAIIGGSWFNKIGIAAIILGMAFFLRYAIENEWIGNRGKVVLGLIVGLSFLAGGERFHRRQLKLFARGLTGGGAAILYLSLYFAFQIYQLISQPAAFTLMVVVTAATVALALRYHSPTILLFAMLGGFFTPFWVSSGLARPVELFTYITILDLGLLAVAWRKDWRFVNALCFLATTALYAGWYAEYYQPEQFWLAETFLTVFYFIFAALAFLIHLLRRQRVQMLDALGIAGTALFYFSGNLALLKSIGAEDYRGLFTAGMAVLYAAFGLLAWRRLREDRLLIYLLSGAAVTFLTVFFPIQIKDDWVPLAWLMEALVLVNVSAILRLVTLQRLALAVGFVAWLALCTYIADHQSTIIRAGEWITFLLGSLGVLITIVIQARAKENAPTDLSRAVVLWEIITLLALPFLLATFWTSLALLALAAAAMLLAGQLAALSRSARTVAFYFVPLAALVIFVREYTPEPVALQHFTPVLNSRFLTYLAASGLLLWYRLNQNLRPEPGAPAPQPDLVFKCAGLLLLALPFFALTLEVLAFYAVRAQSTGASFHAPKHLVLSAVWSLYSLLLLIVGIWQRIFHARAAALLIFALTIIKVAFVDFWLFEKIYRILSAIVFGGILVYASYLYQRHKDKIIAAVIGTDENQQPGTRER